jgi:DNA-binding response OmpR family regulator
VLEHQGGHRVHEADDPSRAAEQLRSPEYELLVLDVALPGEDGVEFCRRVRRFSNVPILIVSARAAVADRVRGLQAGADDYLAKPFDPAELCARVEALLRRAARVPAQFDGKLRLGDLTVDLAEHVVNVRGRRPARLTATELKLFCLLARSPGRVRTRDELEAGLWGQALDNGHNTVNAYISELRRKIEPDPRRPRYIVTVRGQGYKLECRPAVA